MKVLHVLMCSLKLDVLDLGFWVMPSVRNEALAVLEAFPRPGQMPIAGVGLKRKPEAASHGKARAPHLTHRRATPHSSPSLSIHCARTSS
jgi:hypothetical protein